MIHFLSSLSNIVDKPQDNAAFNMEVTASPYRVSTMTCNGSVGTQVDIIVFFENVCIDDSRFVYTEYKVHQHRGMKPKNKKGRGIKEYVQDGPAKKCFDNQVTIIYKISDNYYPNIKLFRNGNIQMTGIRNHEDGEMITKVIADEIRRIHAESSPAIVSDVNKICGGEFKVRMINSNFSVPYLVRRKELHKLLISPEYNNNCNFQGTTYPGVKLYFYWNAQNKSQDGVCTCKEPCFGKGTGDGDGQCKKVTVAVFESGNVLITGANTRQQIDDAYAFITSVLIKHVQLLRKVLPALNKV